MTSQRSTSPDTGTRHRHALLLTVLLVAAIVLLLVLLPRAAAADNARSNVAQDGRQEFEENCVNCHGDNGKGGGELAASFHSGACSRSSLEKLRFLDTRRTRCRTSQRA